MEKDVVHIIQEAITYKYGNISARKLADTTGIASHTTFSKFIKAEFTSMEAEILFRITEDLGLNIIQLLNLKLNKPTLKKKNPLKMSASEALSRRGVDEEKMSENFGEPTDYLEEYDSEYEELKDYKGKYFKVLDLEDVPEQHKFKGNKEILEGDVFYIKILYDDFSYLFTKGTFLACTTRFQSISGEALINDKDFVILKIREKYSLRQFSIENGVSIFRKLSNRKSEFDITGNTVGGIEVMCTLVYASKSLI